jgi:hypothetical protein
VTISHTRTPRISGTVGGAILGLPERLVQLAPQQ